MKKKTLVKKQEVKPTSEPSQELEEMKRINLLLQQRLNLQEESYYREQHLILLDRIAHQIERLAELKKVELEEYETSEDSDEDEEEDEED